MLVKELIHYCNVHPKASTPIASQIIPYYDFTVVISGRLHYVINGMDCIMESGDAILLPPQTKRQRKGLDEDVRYVSFNFTVPDGSSLSLPTHMKNILSSDMCTLLSLCRNEHVSPYYRTEQKIICVLEYMLLELLDLEQHHSRNPYITKAISYISEHITQPISLRDISRHLHLSREYTATLFKQETGKTVSAYVHEEKMKIAKQILLEGNTAIHDIAEQLGYYNYGYFVRIFKKHYNTTPSSFYS